MSQADFEALEPLLRAMPAQEVAPPPIPVEVALKEGAALLAWVEQHPEPRARLEAVGVEPSQWADLQRSLGALQRAQALWDQARMTRRSEEQRRAEQEGYDARAHLSAAIRFHLRRDAQAQAFLRDLQEGDGVADLMADLEALAVFLEQRPDAFARDQTLDPKAEAPRLRELAAKILQGTAAISTTEASLGLLDMRNRAWSHHAQLLDELRAAARYVFRGDTKALSLFTSSYKRTSRRPASAPPA
jgi:hypothetical protein